MTVRVNKQPFNVREKLSELERPVGVKGHELMRAETAQDARDFISAGRKNMIINGDMRISQRVGAANTATTGGGFVIDRYRCEVGAGGGTSMQQVTDAPAGFHNSMKITVTSTDTTANAGDFHYIRHIVEGNNITHLNWGSSNAKTVTLSFWVKSSITGDHGGALWNNAFNRSFPFNYTINSANAWEYKSITIPGCPDGTWESGINRGINIGFIQLSGSTYTGPPGQWNSAGDVAPTTHVNLLATNGSTWYITGIQLEVGKNATDFEHRSYGEELALCQRYYQNSFHQSAGKFPGNTDNDNGMIQTCWSDGNSPFGMFPTPMRAQPTVTLRQRGTNNTGKVEVGGTQKTAAAYQVTNQGVGYIGISSGVAGSWCAFSYELSAEI